MMHHPNMHHQPMSGHPPQHLTGHQAMSAHHTMPPPPMHRENRHVTLTRVALGPSGGGGLGAHGPPQLGLGGMPVHHGPAQRPPHPIRAMPHHPPAQHHSVPQMKPMRRGYMGGGYGGGAVVHTYAPPAPLQPAPAVSHAPHNHNKHTQHSGKGSRKSKIASSTKIDSDIVVSPPSPTKEVIEEASQETSEENKDVTNSTESNAEGNTAAAGENEAARPQPATANSKEKTPMCLVNELARYNKIKHQYRLTSESGPAHKKVFTVTLRLGDTEEYTAEGSSIKRAQHAAASAALAATTFAPPPPRTHHPHAPPPHHHRHSVMPTVELNALAMKLCQPAVYTSVPPVAVGATTVGGVSGAGRGRAWVGVGALGPALVYRVRVGVGGRAWLGEGATPQAARHDAAARALRDLRELHQPAHSPPPQDDAAADPLNEVKSPVSLVHELALKRNLTVTFTVKSERGPPHMRVFITICTVGDMETEGEGNGKKISKRRAAEKMLEEMRRRWPPAMLRPRLTHDKRRHQPTKKKPRNLIKEGSAGGGGGGAGAGGAAGDNPISRLAVARHAVRARSPQYAVLEERGAARRREFLVQCLAPPHAATGLGPNKKTAKRRAAHNVLLAMEQSANASEATVASTPIADSTVTNNSPDKAATAPSTVSTNTTTTDTKRKDSESQNSTTTGGNSEVRQPVPGVLLMDYHPRTGQPQPPNASYTKLGKPDRVSETSATGGGGGNTPGAKDQLMYLSHLLGFTVQFSDFPKRNHGEYLSLVSLSTEPPVMCHGGGPSTAHSHEQCSRAALKALALMGLDTMQNGPGATTKPNPISNGIAE